MDVDLRAVVGVISGVGTIAAAIIIATAKRRDIRDKQYRDLLDERNNLQREVDRLRAKLDTWVDWAYSVRKALRRQHIDVPDLPKDD